MEREADADCRHSTWLQVGRGRRRLGLAIALALGPTWTRGHLSVAKVLPDENLHNHAKCGKLLRAINGDSTRPTCERTWLGVPKTPLTTSFVMDSCQELKLLASDRTGPSWAEPNQVDDSLSLSIRPPACPSLRPFVRPSVRGDDDSSAPGPHSCTTINYAVRPRGVNDQLSGSKWPERRNNSNSLNRKWRKEERKQQTANGRASVHRLTVNNIEIHNSN